MLLLLVAAEVQERQVVALDLRYQAVADCAVMLVLVVVVGDTLAFF
jgi:hypothetical protein